MFCPENLLPLRQYRLWSFKLRKTKLDISWAKKNEQVLKYNNGLENEK